MKRYVFVIGLLAVLTFTGCKEKKEEIPIASNSSSSLDEEDPSDELKDELPGEDIPEYEVKLPGKLSSFTFTIWGETYKLPETFDDFTKLGWEYKGDETSQLGAESYVEDEVFEQEGNLITADLMNPDTESKDISQCYIAGIHVDASNSKSQGIYINLPGEIVFQKSIEDDVTAAYGSPLDRYEEDSSIFLTYEYGMNSTVKMGFDQETKVLMALDISNFRNPEGEEELKNVRDEVTPEVQSYQSPEAFGSHLSEFIVKYDDVFYRLPAPVSSFLDNGWKLDEDGSDKAIKSAKYGYVTLLKNDQKVYAVVYNYGSDATVIKNCFVTTLYGDWDTTKIRIETAGGITLGTDEEELLQKTENEPYEKTENKDNASDIYTFYVDETKSDYTQIAVDQKLHIVRQIKVVHNKDVPEGTVL